MTLYKLFLLIKWYVIITFDKSWWKSGDRVSKVNDLKLFLTDAYNPYITDIL